MTSLAAAGAVSSDVTGLLFSVALAIFRASSHVLRKISIVAGTKINRRLYIISLCWGGVVYAKHTHTNKIKKEKRKLATDNGPRRRARVYRKLFCWSGQRREKAKLNNFFFVNVFDAKQTLIKMQLTTKTKFEWRWKIRRGGCCTKLCCGAAAKVFFFLFFFAVDLGLPTMMMMVMIIICFWFWRRVEKWWWWSREKIV